MPHETDLFRRGKGRHRKLPLCGVRGKKILVDCGLQQGRDERDNQELDFAAGYIDAVVVTHAHIDHSGRIPLLVKQGFTGNIYCTRLTGQLLSIMLRDSAHIQEFEAEWKNRKGKRAGAEPVEPMYTIQDAEAACRLFRGVEYGKRIELARASKRGSWTWGTCWALPA